MMMNTKNFILASGSVHRKALLEQINFVPKDIVTADIDETPFDKEKPTQYVKRMALEKGLNVASRYPGRVVLSADTIIVAGRQIIRKAQNAQEQTKVMQKLSGKGHHVITAVCVVNAHGKATVRVNDTRLIVKSMSPSQIAEYVDTKEWQGCAGYKIDGLMGAYVRKIIGSYSSCVGLPLYETKNLLEGAGIR